MSAARTLKPIRPHATLVIDDVFQKVRTMPHIAYQGWIDPKDGVFVPVFSWRPRVG